MNDGCRVSHTRDALRKTLCNKRNKRPIAMPRNELNNLYNELSIAYRGGSGTNKKQTSLSFILTNGQLMPKINYFSMNLFSLIEKLFVKINVIKLIRNH